MLLSSLVLVVSAVFTTAPPEDPGANFPAFDPCLYVWRDWPANVVLAQNLPPPPPPPDGVPREPGEEPPPEDGESKVQSEQVRGRTVTKEIPGFIWNPSLGVIRYGSGRANVSDSDGYIRTRTMFQINNELSWGGRAGYFFLNLPDLGLSGAHTAIGLGTGYRLRLFLKNGITPGFFLGPRFEYLRTNRKGGGNGGVVGFRFGPSYYQYVNPEKRTLAVGIDFAFNWAASFLGFGDLSGDDKKQHDADFGYQWGYEITAGVAW